MFNLMFLMSNRSLFSNIAILPALEILLNFKYVSSGQNDRLVARWRQMLDISFVSTL
jgi:hypothetical protein